MSGEWKECCLADLIEIKHGFAFPGAGITDEPSANVLLSPGNIEIGGGFKGDKFKYFQGNVPDDYVLGAGELIVTMTDLSKQSDTLGFPAIVPKAQQRRFLHNQRLGKVEVKPNADVEKLFIYYLLRTPAYRNEILASATGTTVKHTSPNRILRFKTSLPPLPEQRRIAKILGDLDDKIELNRTMNETLEQMARALFKSWFIDFDPVRAKMEGRQPSGMDAATAALFPDRLVDSELGLIPEGWEVKALGEIVECVGGGTPSTKESRYWENGKINWATPKDLASIDVPILVDTERCITDAGLAKVSSGLLPAGTLLMSSRAPVGYLAISTIDVAINQGFIAMLSSDSMSSHYMLQWCTSNLEEIRNRASGTTFAEISKASFRQMSLVLPPSDLMRCYTKAAVRYYDKITSNIDQSRTLSTLRDTLLPKLVGGEVRV